MLRLLLQRKSGVWTLFYWCDSDLSIGLDYCGQFDLWSNQCQTRKPQSQRWGLDNLASSNSRYTVAISHLSVWPIQSQNYGSVLKMKNRPCMEIDLCCAVGKLSHHTPIHHPFVKAQSLIKATSTCASTVFRPFGIVFFFLSLFQKLTKRFFFFFFLK